MIPGRFYLSLILCAVFIGMAGPVFAQKCNSDYEVITRLRKPDIGSYNMWDSIYGERDKSERFIGGLKSVTKNIVIAGESRTHDDGDAAVLLVELDRRGRVVWEQEHVVKNLKGVVKFLHTKDGYAVMGNQKDSKNRAHIWIGFFDLTGGLVRHKIIKGGKLDLTGHDMIAATDEKGFMLVTSAQGRGYESQSYAVLYRLNSKGHVLSDRAYLPGLENRILGLSIQDDNFYIATGYTLGEDGRKLGWVLRLTDKGTILWQRQYPRGLSASVKKSTAYTKPYIVTIGDAEPSDRKNKAGWVMLLDENSGDIGWQRYYSGDFDFYGRDIIAHDDGQISVLIDGENPPGQEEPEYARVLTLSPRGVILLSDTYYNSKGAGAYDVLLGHNQERILVGYSDMVYQIEDSEHPEEEPRLEYSREGWVVAGAPAEPYNDPCIQSYDFIP